MFQTHQILVFGRRKEFVPRSQTFQSHKEKESKGPAQIPLPPDLLLLVQTFQTSIQTQDELLAIQLLLGVVQHGEEGLLVEKQAVGGGDVSGRRGHVQTAVPDHALPGGRVQVQLGVVQDGVGVDLEAEVEEGGRKGEFE